MIHGYVYVSAIDKPTLNSTLTGVSMALEPTKEVRLEHGR
jgi:hypothetical protein